jgi:hypothetical protein
MVLRRISNCSVSVWLKLKCVTNVVQMSVVSSFAKFTDGWRNIGSSLMILSNVSN